MGLCLFVFIALCAMVESSPPLPRDFRGVNIGGWLVLESWITPSLYADNGVKDGLGEWGFCQTLGKQAALKALTPHWDTWVTFAHLQTLQQAGVNWIRVPVGYWIVDIQPDEPFVEGGMFYLQRLLGWAAQLGLNVLVDLHGAPGSQNGHDNSGRTGPIQWNTPANINRTVHDLGLLYQAVGNYSAVQAMELLNEPWTTFVGGPIQISTLQNFYLQAHDHLRGLGYGGDIVIADGWTDGAWDNFMKYPQYQGIYIDTHIYRCFGASSPSEYQNIVQTCTNVNQRLHGLTQRDWTIVGEYSLCLDNTTLSYNEKDWNKFATLYEAAQITAYSGGAVAGSFFWNFRIEPSSPLDPMWDFLLGIERGYMPQNAAQWSIPGCG